MNRLVWWFRAARLHFLLGSGLAYLIGALMARRETGALAAVSFGAGLGIVWALQLATQFFNEYFDQPTDRLNRRRTVFNGGSGVLAIGAVDPGALLVAGGVLALIAVAVLWSIRDLATFGFGTVVVFGLAAVGALSYSAPPISLSWRGWGEAATAVIVALLVPLFAYNLQTGRVSLTLILTCIPFAALIFANMLNVAFPDHEADRSAGKRTLVVVLGTDRAARLFSILLVAGYAAPWLTLGWGLPLPVLLAESMTFPIGLLSLREVRHGGYRRAELFFLNTFLGVSAVIAVGVAEALGFLLAGPAG